MKKSFARKLINSFTRSHTSRTTAEVSAESSTLAADLSQSNNSAATSRNLREVSARLDSYLEQSDAAGGGVEVDIISMSRQIEKVKRYLNGSLPDSIQTTSLDSKHTELIRLAAWSAKEAYASENSPMNHVLSPEMFSEYEATEHSESIEASFCDGTVKATRIRLFSSREKPSSRVLVVAIRGSTSKRRDWTVNFDDIGKGTDGEGFLDDDKHTFHVHGGFLECAKAMVGEVSKAICSVLSNCEDEDGAGVQLLFTGHSAGGAVASLLYSNMVSPHPSSLGNLCVEFSSIHCIVFGAPPVTTPALYVRRPDSIFYSIINEGDPVPRIDMDYIEALIKIYISPMPEIRTELELPQMLLETSGNILFLKDGVQGFCRALENDGQKENKRILETTIFGNPRAHKMDMYLWKVGVIPDTAL